MCTINNGSGGQIIPVKMKRTTLLAGACCWVV